MTYNLNGLTVSIDQSTQYATVYGLNDKVMATFSRRRVLDHKAKYEWQVHLTDGSKIWEGFLIRQGLRAIQSYHYSK